MKNRNISVLPTIFIIIIIVNNNSKPSLEDS